MRVGDVPWCGGPEGGRRGSRGFGRDRPSPGPEPPPGGRRLASPLPGFPRGGGRDRRSPHLGLARCRGVGEGDRSILRSGVVGVPWFDCLHSSPLSRGELSYPLDRKICVASPSVTDLEIPDLLDSRPFRLAARAACRHSGLRTRGPVGRERSGRWTRRWGAGRPSAVPLRQFGPSLEAQAAGQSFRGCRGDGTGSGGQTSPHEQMAAWPWRRALPTLSGADRAAIGGALAASAVTAPRGSLDLAASKEALNRAYVMAVAAAARCITSTPVPDHEKVDLTIRQTANHLEYNRVSLDLQLKATAGDALKDDHVVYSLRKDDYNDLCDDRVYNPRILVVYLLPKESERWLYQHDRAMLMKHCAYWMSLRGQTATAGSTKTVHIPRSQVFNVDGLCGLLKVIGDGGTP